MKQSSRKRNLVLLQNQVVFALIDIILTVVNFTQIIYIFNLFFFYQIRTKSLIHRSRVFVPYRKKENLISIVRPGALILMRYSRWHQIHWYMLHKFYKFAKKYKVLERNKNHDRTPYIQRHILFSDPLKLFVYIVAYNAY